jgi:hypothetical protein
LKSFSETDMPTRIPTAAAENDDDPEVTPGRRRQLCQFTVTALSITDYAASSRPSRMNESCSSTFISGRRS